MSHHCHPTIISQQEPITQWSPNSHTYTFFATEWHMFHSNQQIFAPLFSLKTFFFSTYIKFIFHNVYQHFYRYFLTRNTRWKKTANCADHCMSQLMNIRWNFDIYIHVYLILKVNMFLQSYFLIFCYTNIGMEQYMCKYYLYLLSRCILMITTIVLC